MAAVTTTPNSLQKPKRRSTIPPKRGHIKAQIFESFVEMVTSFFPPKVLSRENNIHGGGGDESDAISTATTSMGSISPPPPPA